MKNKILSIHSNNEGNICFLNFVVYDNYYYIFPGTFEFLPAGALAKCLSHGGNLYCISEANKL